MKEYKILREQEEPGRIGAYEKLAMSITEYAEAGWTVRSFGASHACCGERQPYYASTVFYALMEREKASSKDGEA